MEVKYHDPSKSPLLLKVPLNYTPIFYQFITIKAPSNRWPLLYPSFRCRLRKDLLGGPYGHKCRLAPKVGVAFRKFA